LCVEWQEAGSTNAGAALTLQTGRALLSAVATAIATRIRGDRDGSRVELAVGDLAPEFTLQASDGATYNLTDFAGRAAVVIAWFPKAFTSGCTAECRSLGLTRQALARFDAAVFAASCDTVETNRAFAASMGIDIPILSDPDRRVARAYGVLGSYGLPRRWTFYIDSGRRLVAIDRQVRTATHGADIVTALDRLGVSRRP
jgi:peroxiredoxin Q/BCP